MIAKALKNYFDQFIELDIQVWENFEKLGELVHFPEETILKESNTTEKYMNLLIKGSGGILLWNKNNFVCIDIRLDNGFLNDYISFTLQKTSATEVRLFEKSTIFRIPYQNFQETFKEGAYGDKITRLVTEKLFIEKQQQQVDLLTKTAKERYLDLLNNNKEIDRLPLKYLASYLGITPQSLSRIRADKV